MLNFEDDARRGLISLTHTRLHQHLVIYRFGSHAAREHDFTSPWWLGYSPFEALKKYARNRAQTVFAAAEQCLALPLDDRYPKKDRIIEAKLRRALSAWSGTPRTLVSRQRRRLEPDRDVTQLYIPGLNLNDVAAPNNIIWKEAFHLPLRVIATREPG
jgi:hypothetical protein